MEIRLIFLNFFFLVTGDETSLKRIKNFHSLSKKSPKDFEKNKAVP